MVGTALLPWLGPCFGSSEIREAQNLYERVGIALENAETKAEKQVGGRPLSNRL